MAKPAIVETSNTSNKGVIFTSKSLLIHLFNHKGKNFTLYNNGSGATFVDYGSGGLLDNIEHDPIIPEEKSENNTNSNGINSDKATTVYGAIHLAFYIFYPDRYPLNRESFSFKYIVKTRSLYEIYSIGWQRQHGKNNDIKKCY